MRNRLELPETALRVWAKTGTVFYGNAMVGYLYTLSGKRLMFSIMMMDPTERKNINQYADQLPPNLANRAESWSKSSRLLQDEILRDWIVKY